MIDVQTLIGKGYNNCWFTNCKARYRVLEGGRSTKKSVNIAGYEPLFKIMCDRRRNIIMCRQDDTNNSTSTYANLVSLIDDLGLSFLFKCKVSPYSIIYRPTGQQIIFKGCNNPTAIASTKFPHGELTDIYFEEASELDSYDTFRKIDGSVRSQKADLQITLLLNGWDGKSWIYETFFKDRLEDDYEYLESHDYVDYYDPEFNLGQGKGLYLHKSTWRINEFRASYKDESMMLLKQQAPEIYKVEGLGMWGNVSDTTYPYFNENLIKPHSELTTRPLSLYTIGIDVGLSNGEGKIAKNTKDNPDRVRSAMSMVLQGLTADYTTVINFNEYFYSNGNQLIKKDAVQIAEEMTRKIIEWIDLYRGHSVLMKGVIVCYVDCADIGFRNLLEAKAKQYGLINIRFLPSTKNKIQTRVDFENLLMAFGEMQFSNQCPNLTREIKNARQDKNGACREDIDDHAITSMEYAMIPVLPKIRRYSTFKPH